MFVTFEGVDGSGKSTQASLLADWLRERGAPVVLSREPGGTPLGERIRSLLLDGDDMSPWAEAALYAAARAELAAHVIRPELERGGHVVCDRYLDSSVAYQGIVRGLGAEPVRELSLRATGSLLPDRTFLLLLAPEQAATRSTGVPDRIEREGAEFMRRVEEAYRALAAEAPERWVALDGDRPAEAIAEEVREHVRALL